MWQETLFIVVFACVFAAATIVAAANNRWAAPIMSLPLCTALQTISLLLVLIAQCGGSRRDYVAALVVSVIMAILTAINTMYVLSHDGAMITCRPQPHCRNVEVCGTCLASFTFASIWFMCVVVRLYFMWRTPHHSPAANDDAATPLAPNANADADDSNPGSAPNRGDAAALV